MKYIRTKDGRILDLNRIKLYAESYSFNNESETHLSIEWDIIREEIDIIKQADTIEELCDEFVVYAPNEERIKRYRSSEYPETLKKIYKAIKKDKKEAYFYGAIWTDKGLIYVAKMNESGELELL